MEYITDNSEPGTAEGRRHPVMEMHLALLNRDKLRKEVLKRHRD